MPSENRSAFLSVTQLKAIFCLELGIDMSKVEDKTTLKALGIDSLATISLLWKFRKVTNQNLPDDIFDYCATFGDIAALLCCIHEGNTVPSSSGVDDCSDHDQEHFSQCTSVNLHGFPHPSQPNLFLLPDGSGSANSYIHLPQISSSVAVVCLNSPFQNSPSEFTVPLETVAAEYVKKIVQIQPEGPIILGGWSIGGVYAYEVAVQLLRQERQVSGLIFIDSLCPQRQSSLPIETISLLQEYGVFGGMTQWNSVKSRGMSSTMKEHFIRSIHALTEYNPTPLPASLVCHTIWAKQGVLEVPERRQDISRQAHDLSVSFSGEGFNDMQQWLLLKKHSYTSQGWECLLPNATRIRCSVIPGNHFSIVKPSNVHGLSRAIRRALEEITQTV